MKEKKENLLWRFYPMMPPCLWKETTEIWNISGTRMLKHWIDEREDKAPGINRDSFCKFTHIFFVVAAEVFCILFLFKAYYFWAKVTNRSYSFDYYFFLSFFVLLSRMECPQFDFPLLDFSSFFSLSLSLSRAESAPLMGFSFENYKKKIFHNSQLFSL